MDNQKNSQPLSGQSTTPRRSSMFFESDLRAAAETAAFGLECYGLAPDQTDDLAEKLEDTIRDFFEEVRNA